MEDSFLHKVLFGLVTSLLVGGFIGLSSYFPDISKLFRRKRSKAAESDEEEIFWEKEKEENAAMYTPIYDRAGLEAIRDNLSGRYILMNDIDLSAGDSWNPIGDFISPFRGRFNGKGHTIKGATGKTEPIQGIFGYIGKEGVVYNLHVRDANFIISGLSGGMAADNAGMIVRCSVTGEIAGEMVGGIAGRNSGALIHCQATCRLEGQESAGGLTGINEGLIMACHADQCKIVAHPYAGGLVAKNFYGSAIYGSYSVGMSAEGRIRAALTACNESAIISCYATLPGEPEFGLFGINESYATIQSVVSPFVEGEEWEMEDTDEVGTAKGTRDGYCSLLKHEAYYEDDGELFYHDLLIGVDLHSAIPDYPSILATVEGITLKNAPTVISDDEGVIRFVRDRVWKAEGIWMGVDDGAPSINPDYDGE